MAGNRPVPHAQKISSLNLISGAGIKFVEGFKMAGMPGRSGGARPGAGRKRKPPELKFRAQPSRRVADRSCSVYVVHEVDDPSVCKIGIAVDVAKRVSSLQIGTWRNLRVAHVARLPTEEAAFSVEHAVHAALAPLHVRGEWFRVDPARAQREVTAAADRLIEVFKAAALSEVLDAVGR